MTLDRHGREEYLYPFTANVADLGDVQVSFDGITWHPAEIEDANVVFMCAGPDAVNNPAGTVVLPLGIHQPLFWFTDDPQDIVRRGEHVVVV